LLAIAPSRSAAKSGTKEFPVCVYRVFCWACWRVCSVFSFRGWEESIAMEEISEASLSPAPRHAVHAADRRDCVALINGTTCKTGSFAWRTPYCQPGSHFLPDRLQVRFCVSVRLCLLLSSSFSLSFSLSLSLSVSHFLSLTFSLSLPRSRSLSLCPCLSLSLIFSLSLSLSHSHSLSPHSLSLSLSVFLSLSLSRLVCFYHFLSISIWHFASFFLISSFFAPLCLYLSIFQHSLCLLLPI